MPLTSKLTFGLFNPVQVWDARDRRVPLFDPAKASVAKSAGVGLDSELLAQARKAMWRSISAVGWAGFALNVLLQLAMIVLGTYGIYNMTHGAFTKPGDGIGPAVVCVSATAGLLAAWSQLRSSHASRLRNGFLACRCCASCGYSLGGLDPAPDGCTVCPECGSAWRFDTGLAGLEKALEEQRRKLTQTPPA